MDGCKSAKQQAFEQQTLAHTEVLYRYSLHLKGNAADADDLLQETYLKAFRFWDTYDEGTNLRAWLFQILKNSSISMYRKTSREPDMEDYGEMTKLSSLHHDAANPNNLQDQVFNNLLDDDVSGAMAGLGEDYRTVVILSDIEGLSYEEIAGFVGCPLGTVRSRLHRGRQLLQSKLYHYAKEHGYVRSMPNSVRGR